MLGNTCYYAVKVGVFTDYNIINLHTPKVRVTLCVDQSSNIIICIDRNQTVRRDERSMIVSF